MSVNFITTPERFEVSDWRLIRGDQRITDASELMAGDKVSFGVDFFSKMLDGAAVLITRAYQKDKLLSLKAQEFYIFPVPLHFYLTSDEFIVPEGTDRIELSLYKDFESVTPEEEDTYLLGKNIHGVIPTKFDTYTEDFEFVIETPSEKPTQTLGNYEPAKEFFKGTVCFVQESAALWIKDAKYRAKECTIRKDGKLWIPLDTAKKLFKKDFENENNYVELSSLAKQLGAYHYINRFGLGVISDLPYDYSETKYGENILLMTRFIEFDRPKAADFKRLFKERTRPRSFFIKEDIEHALKVTQTNERAKWYSDKLIKIADECMAEPVQYEVDRGPENASAITAIIDYQEILAFYWAYLKTNDRKYIERIKEVALAMSGFEHLCGSFFALFTSRAAITLALAYELLYDEFTKEERDKIAKAIIEKCIMPNYGLYYGEVHEDLWPWIIRRNNWNAIANSGLIFAACVIFDEYETDLCADLLEKAVQSMEFFLLYFAPDGELFEGLGYATYALNYLAFCITALERNFGTAFHIDDCAGIREAYKVPFQLIAPTGFFATGDAPTSMRLCHQHNTWWAKRLGNHDIQEMRHMQLVHPKGEVMFSDIFWFDEDANETPLLEKDALFETTQNAISRSDWGPDARIMFVHGGDNLTEHVHMDLGNFEFELGGFRFAQEMGIDDVCYCCPGSRYQYEDDQMDYYVARAEGHNVYVINPDRSPGQRMTGKVKCVPLERTDDVARYMFDLESAYRGQVKEAKRYCELRENRQVFVVQDEITPMKSGDEIFWLWHTFAEISFPKDPIAVAIEDNTVILTAPNGRKLHLQVDATVDFVLRKGMSLPMDKSPSRFDQLQGGMISNMLSIYFKTTDEPLIFRVTAWEEGSDYQPGELKSYGK